jgi:hypothetical protein
MQFASSEYAPGFDVEQDRSIVPHGGRGLIVVVNMDERPGKPPRGQDYKKTLVRVVDRSDSSSSSRSSNPVFR